MDLESTAGAQEPYVVVGSLVGHGEHAIDPEAFERIRRCYSDSRSPSTDEELYAFMARSLDQVWPSVQRQFVLGRALEVGYSLRRRGGLDEGVLWCFPNERYGVTVVAP